MKKKINFKIPEIVVLTILAGLWMFSTATLSAQEKLPMKYKNPDAVKSVLDGKISEADVTWWGYDDRDATDYIQEAINSGAKVVKIPNVGSDWVTDPIKLAGNQEIILESGVVVSAKRGDYKKSGDCLFTAGKVDNLIIRGYGAIIKMQKNDYIIGMYQEDFMYGMYAKGEWRMGISIEGCNNVKILGLTIKDTGGDGIYISGSGDRKMSSGIYIKDVTCENNFRQGISVIGVDGLTVEDSRFNGTWGTPPAAGVDIEPNMPDEPLKNIVFRNCTFKDNYGAGIMIYLGTNRPTTQNISVLFDNCIVTSERGSGIYVGDCCDDGPKGTIEFRKCSIENTERNGLTISGKSVNSARLKFTGCIWKNTGTGLDNFYLRPDSLKTTAPLLIYLQRPEFVKKQGGIDFTDCYIEDSKDRPVIAALEKTTDYGLFDVTGTITVKSPFSAKAELGTKLDGVTLEIKQAKKKMN